MNGEPPRVEELVGRLAGTPVEPSRRGAFVDEDRIARDIRWFYLRRMKGMSKYALAKEANVPWQTVNEGIKRAERLLRDVPTGDVLIGLRDPRG